MAVRKPVNDEDARDQAAELGYQAIHRSEIVDDNASGGRAVVDAFPYAEYEYTTSKVAGEAKTFRRLVLTGEWEITAGKPDAS